MPGEPVCRRERRAGESVVDSGYMEAGGRGRGQPAGDGEPQGAVYYWSEPLERTEWEGHTHTSVSHVVFQQQYNFSGSSHYLAIVEFPSLLYICLFHFILFCRARILTFTHTLQLQMDRVTTSSHAVKQKDHVIQPGQWCSVQIQWHHSAAEVS